MSECSNKGNEDSAKEEDVMIFLFFPLFFKI